MGYAKYSRMNFLFEKAEEIQFSKCLKAFDEEKELVVLKQLDISLYQRIRRLQVL